MKIELLHFLGSIKMSPLLVYRIKNIQTHHSYIISNLSYSLLYVYIIHGYLKYGYCMVSRFGFQTLLKIVNIQRLRYGNIFFLTNGLFVCFLQMPKTLNFYLRLKKLCLSQSFDCGQNNNIFEIIGIKFKNVSFSQSQYHLLKYNIK